MPYIMRILLLLGALVYSNLILCQDTGSNHNNDTNDSPIINVISPVKEARPYDGGDYFFLSQKEFWLAVIVLICMIILISFEIWLIKTRNFSDENITRLVILTILIMGAIFLIMAGYNDRIVAPAFALFGTIAGYIFGRNNKEPRNEGN